MALALIKLTPNLTRTRIDLPPKAFPLLCDRLRDEGESETCPAIRLKSLCLDLNDTRGLPGEHRHLATAAPLLRLVAPSLEDLTILFPTGLKVLGILGNIENEGNGDGVTHVALEYLQKALCA